MLQLSVAKEGELGYGKTCFVEDQLSNQMVFENGFWYQFDTGSLRNQALF